MGDIADVPVVNIPNQLGIAGRWPAADEAIGRIYRQDGYVFCGFRYLSEMIPPDALARRRKVLLVRDPRDILVSYYYSMKFSHPVPTEGERRDYFMSIRAKAQSLSIDDFVLSSATTETAERYRGYIPVLDRDWRVYRYEDVVFRKRAWLTDLADYLALGLGEDEIFRIADKHDIFPEQEDVNKHVRQVKPGNYRVQLKPETIEALNHSLADIIEAFGYATLDSAEHSEPLTRAIHYTPLTGGNGQTPISRDAIRSGERGPEPH